jgi:hypothetical protein
LKESILYLQKQKPAAFEELRKELLVVLDQPVPSRKAAKGSGTGKA